MIAAARFAGSDDGGRRAAVIYSLIESVKLNGLNPQHYLGDVVARLADHPVRRIAELLTGTGNRSSPPEPGRSPSAYREANALAQNAGRPRGDDT